ncbi:MAG: hemerythrin domain-containing protein [Caldimonas sp.]
MDAVELLIHQHRSIESLMKSMEEERDGAPRADLLARIGDELSVHLASEEELFYPAVHAGRTEDVLLESLEEHLSLKRLLADLLELPLDAQTFAPKFQVLKEQAEHHHKEEEDHLFPKVLTLIDSSARAELGRAMEALQARLRKAGDPRDAIADQTEEAAPLE